jgi:hypothetical protein
MTTQSGRVLSASELRALQTRSDLFPSIPFHRLAATHAAIRDRLGFVQPGYVRWNIGLVRRLAVPR